MQDFLELAVGAAASGCVYGLIALAYLLVLRPTGIINFAVGEWAMLAAFGGFLTLTRYEWPYPVGMAVVLLFLFVVGWATERVVVRPLVEKGAPILAPILALLGMLVVFRESISVSFPPDPMPVPYAFGIGRLKAGARTPAMFVSALSPCFCVPVSLSPATPRSHVIAGARSAAFWTVISRWSP